MVSKLTVMKQALNKRKPLKVQKTTTKATGDEPADTLQGSARVNTQGNTPNPGANPLQDNNPVNYKKAPQPNNNEGTTLQNASSAVNNRDNRGKLKSKGAVHFKRTVRQ